MGRASRGQRRSIRGSCVPWLNERWYAQISSLSSVLRPTDSIYGLITASSSQHRTPSEVGTGSIDRACEGENTGGSTGLSNIYVREINASAAAAARTVDARANQAIVNNLESVLPLMTELEPRQTRTSRCRHKCTQVQTPERRSRDPSRYRIDPALPRANWTGTGRKKHRVMLFVSNYGPGQTCVHARASDRPREAPSPTA
jgi:hypothetical protein